MASVVYSKSFFKKNEWLTAGLIYEVLFTFFFWESSKEKCFSSSVLSGVSNRETASGVAHFWDAYWAQPLWEYQLFDYFFWQLSRVTLPFFLSLQIISSACLWRHVVTSTTTGSAKKNARLCRGTIRLRIHGNRIPTGSMRMERRAWKSVLSTFSRTTGLVCVLAQKTKRFVGTFLLKTIREIYEIQEWDIQLEIIFENVMEKIYDENIMEQKM
jgi:hypothetical protein